MKIINNGGVCTPIGFSSGGINIDVKGNGGTKEDWGILYSMVPSICSAVFTKNKVCAAPVKLAKQQLSENNKISAIVVNSGNANACTGNQGIEDCRTILKEISNRLEIQESECLISSTGVIGERLPVDKFISNADKLISSITDENDKFSKAILTTDTVTKKIAVLVETSNGIYVIGGTCKGAGMIAPEMATMLAFITTDAVVSEEILDNALKNTVENSFNCITVDGDMSTNDSVFLLSNGMSGISIHSPQEIKEFEEALSFVAKELAKMIVKDGEGATKFVEIIVKGAKNNNDAKKCASKIANSPLVKTMFAGEDPNWGRLLASAGSSLIDMVEEKTDIYFNDLKYVENGIIIDKNLENKVHKIMCENSYSITIDLHMGSGKSVFYTTDLTKKYISINADYRS
jgi:glutamate N-acetyltransferase/amino-acid N-acetyltransferase